jgi:hypothetical protein
MTTSASLHLEANPEKERHHCGSSWIVDEGNERVRTTLMMMIIVIIIIIIFGPDSEFSVASMVGVP